MTLEWQAKAEAFTIAASDVVAMVDKAAANPDLAHKDAVRLKHSTKRIVEAVEGLISRLQQNGADQDFIRTLQSPLRALRSADARAATLVIQASDPPDRATHINGRATTEASANVRLPRRPWFPGRLGDFPDKLSLVGDGVYSLDVVVESFDHDALDALFGPKIDAGAGKETFCIGELLPESHSLYDPITVGVYVSGLKVGHLSRDDARRFREAAADAGIAGQSVDADVLVTQGWRPQGGGEGPYRVRIDARVPFAFGARSRGARTA
jgi:hypothetical protein